jgi:hypothetical protein
MGQEHRFDQEEVWASSISYCRGRRNQGHAPDHAADGSKPPRSHAARCQAPVCADHEPDDRSGDRATHGAACHGCLLIAETSCEIRNLFLDRSLLVSTMADDLSCFFK